MTPAAVERVRVPGADEPPGATWSNALRIGPEIVMSGATAHPAAGLDTYAQTMRVLTKLLAAVEAAGGGIRNVYKLVIYVTDIADKDAIGRARRDFFEPPFPCSTLVEVKGLVHPELKVEIDAWARLDVDLSLCR